MSQDQTRSASDLPSSFDDNTQFSSEGWTSKLWRHLKEEPWVPIGCAVTCYALFGASKAMRQGRSYDVNRYFRMRVYAQGATLAAVVLGGIYFRDARMERASKQKKIAEAEAQAKRDRWVKELEARDREDQEWRERHTAVEKRAQEAIAKLKGEQQGKADSVIEEVEKLRWRDLWKTR